MDNFPRFFLRSVAQRVLFVTSFALLALLILPAVSHAATVSRYWIAGPGNWDDTAHWSLSTGGAGGASAPVAGQEAHFDRFSGGGTVTLNAAVDVSGLHLSSAYTGTLLQTTNEIRVGTGNLMVGSGRILGGTSTLSLSGSYTQTGGIVRLQETFTLTGNLAVTDTGTTSPPTFFTNTGTLLMNGVDQTIRMGSGSLTNLTISASSGSTLNSNLRVSGTLTISAGSNLALGVYALSATSSTITNLGTISENTGKIHHTATTVLLADSSYAEDNSFDFGETVYITLTDGDENIDGTSADTVSVNIGTGPDTETISLVETTVSSGIFRNSIPTAFKDQNINSQNGTLEAGGTSTLTLSFTDAQDALGNADTASLAAAATSTTTTTTTATSSGGGGGGGGSRRGAVLTSLGLARQNTTGGVTGEVTGNEEEASGETVEEESATPSSSPWSDLDLDDVHADAAMRLFAAGIVKGNDDGTVQLNRSLSRVEALTLLVRTLGEESTEGSLPFNDIDPDAWYAGPLRAALNLAIIKGFPDGTFRPGESLNLVQSLKIISIALGFADQNDESLAANWYDPYVIVGREAGLVHGTITPDRTVTRGEFFEWLALLLP